MRRSAFARRTQKRTPDGRSFVAALITSKWGLKKHSHSGFTFQPWMAFVAARTLEGSYDKKSTNTCSTARCSSAICPTSRDVFARAGSFLKLEILVV